MKILIVEDEPKLAGFIEKGLRQENYLTDKAFNGIEAEEMALINEYDLILKKLLTRDEAKSREYHDKRWNEYHKLLGIN
jgi:DNA-binding response OmpR family regulator